MRTNDTSKHFSCLYLSLFVWICLYLSGFVDYCLYLSFLTFIVPLCLYLSFFALTVEKALGIYSLWFWIVANGQRYKFTRFGTSALKLSLCCGRGLGLPFCLFWGDPLFNPNNRKKDPVMIRGLLGEPYLWTYNYHNPT